MKKEEIKKMLENRLEEYMNETQTSLSGSRQKVLDEFKKQSLIKDYRFTQNWKSANEYPDNKFIFGSNVGFDRTYLVIL